jgi:hypothetical protein
MQSKTATLSFTIERGITETFFFFLQGGFTVTAQVGCSITNYLCTQCGIGREYVTKRISTVFFDHKPVDNMDSAIIRDGSTIALSGAMPGLVGAVMRVGSYYASFRSSITYKENFQNYRQEHGKIHLKLFNMVMRDLGKSFLERGIYAESGVLKNFLLRQQEILDSGCREIILDGEPVCFKDLPDKQFLIQDGSVFLSVNTFKKE